MPSQFRLAPQIKPHELVAAKTQLEKLDTKAMLDLITRVDLDETKAIIQIDVEKVATLIQIDTSKLDLDYLRVEEPIVLRKRTNGFKLTWVGYKGEPNHALIRAIVTAQAWVDEIKAGKTINELTKSHGISSTMIWKRISLAFLSPKLIAEIIGGTTIQELTIEMLISKDVPLDWAQQEALFLG